MNYPDRSPSSSCASSPVFGPVDSSPPSSPTPENLSLDSPPHTPSSTLVHPFAGSAKATRPPPQYELKSGSPHSPARPPPSSSGYRPGGLESPTQHRHPLPDVEQVRRDMFARGLASPAVTPMLGRSTLVNTAKSDDQRWEEAIEDAIMERKHQRSQEKTVIDLSGGDFMVQLQSIPSSIQDLNKIVILPDQPVRIASQVLDDLPHKALFNARRYERIQTAPALAQQNPSISLLRQGSERLPGKPEDRTLASPPRHEIHLFLSANMITVLPSELFTLENLTVLTLRNNTLTYIPPAISWLKNLRDLNIAQNRLTYLPSEMLSMKFSMFSASGNPFLPPPITSASPLSVTPRPYIKIIPGLLPYQPHSQPSTASSTTVIHKVPPLTEHCLRVLLAPHRPRTLFLPGPVQAVRTSSTGRHARKPGATPNNLAALYTVPLQPDEWHLPAPHAQALRACLPDGVAHRVNVGTPIAAATPSGLLRLSSAAKGKGRADMAPEPPAPGVCQNPRHGQDQRHFYVHAEERFTWETAVSGKRLPFSDGVPFRWRGCSLGCTSWLGDELVEEQLQEVEAGSDDGVTSLVGLGIGFD